MVVVCEPITVRLNTSPPPEHWSLYSVITPFGSIGGLQLSVTLLEVMELIIIISGGVPGTVAMWKINSYNTGMKIY